MRLISLVSCCLLLAEVSVAQAAPSPTRSLCPVSGQVVQDPGGTPLRNVVVSLLPEGGFSINGRDQQNPYSAVTDPEGHFRIEGAPPGGYRVMMARNGFVATNHRSSVYSSTSLSLTPGQETTGLLFRMQPAGVIQGKIVDEDGEAMPEVNVVAVFASNHNPSMGGATNDLGEYRIPGLTAGNYLVLADASQQQATALKPGEPRVYAPTFYPGTMDRGQATPVEVHPGDEASANFNIVSSRTFTVRGSVSGLAPRTQPGTSHLLVHTVALADSHDGQQFQGTVLPNGRFEITGVLPGSYRARVSAQIAGEWQMIGTGQTIEVRAADVDGIQLSPEPAGEVRGRFRADTDGGQKPDWSQINLQIDPDEREGSDGPVVGKVAIDGSFKVENVPAGNYHVVVTTNSNLEGWRDYIVKEVLLDGRDVGDSGFSTVGGVVSLEIVASGGGSAIEGNVVDEDGKPVSDVQVVCIPDASRRKRHDIYQQVETDQRGHFALRGLNPGEYQVFTLQDPGEDITDSEFVKAHEGFGESVKLDPGERKGIVLKLPPDAGQP